MAVTDLPMTGHTEVSLAAMSEALRATTGSEGNVQSRLAGVLRSLGYDVEVGYQTGDGPCDLYLANRRVVIETKAPRKADPLAKGSGEDETQFEQLARYVRADHARERKTLEFEMSSRPWVGLLTDGRDWWHWEFTPDEDGELLMPDVNEPSSERHFVDGDAASALSWLHSTTEYEVGLRWVPADPSPMLVTPFINDVRQLYDDLVSSPQTLTKQQLWLDMLRASGCAPEQDHDQVTLFCSHTLLVMIARAVIYSLTHEDGDAGGYLSDLLDGFVSWVLDCDAHAHTDTPDHGMHETGVRLATRLYDEVVSYDWRRRERDVLRTLYEGLIDSEHRKAFGEYYTPDWLAAAVVEEVLDDEWVEELRKAYEAVPQGSLPDGVGVLDPACGSGTFLFHAADRIARSPGVVKQSYNAVRLADFLAAAVCGVDVHPVAVELSRATLLRAMPAMPSLGAGALRVYQGDSLMCDDRVTFDDSNDNPQLTASQQQALALADSSSLDAVSPTGTLMTLPRKMLQHAEFDDLIRRFVEAACGVAAEHPAEREVTLDDVPDACYSMLDENDRCVLRQTLESLVNVIVEEGNGVWAWYFRNAAAARSLCWRKVDRIVGNPPWVRMNEIQVERRRRQMERLAGDLRMWGVGKVTTSVNLAGLFLARCDDLFLVQGAKSGWVLPDAALDAKNWEAVRTRRSELAAKGLASAITAEWDLREVKRPPFAQSASCVWVMGSPTDAPPLRRVLRNRDGAADVSASDAWPDVFERTTWETATPSSFAPSPYASSRDGDCAFRNGATLFPVVLVKVQAGAVGTPDAHGRVKVTTDARTRRNSQWHGHPAQTGSVPGHMVREVLTPNDLLPFTTRAELTRFVLPLTAGGALMTDDDLRRVHFWRKNDNAYRARRGLGENTPTSLKARVAFNGSLVTQVALKSKTKKVVYNKSGKILRAARVSSSLPVNNECYWWQPSSADEGRYLVALLNAPSLRHAFTQARDSNWHFDRTPWFKVPIPAFDPTDVDHRKLVTLGTNAEKRANQAIKQPTTTSLGQRKASNLIRDGLKANGVLDQIDEVVRRVLPAHAT